VVEDSIPQVIDEGDKVDLEVMTEAWASEAPFLDEISEAVEAHGERAQIRVAYPMRLARLNFVRPSTLVGALGNLLSLELAELDVLSNEARDDEATMAILTRLIEAKRAAYTAIEAAADKAAARLAAEAAGEEVVVETAPKDPSDLEYPWKDPDMALPDRMDSAKGGSLFDKLFAAMAQTDCTACGYDCEGYAQAIADGEDKDLDKCVPGEDDTANMLKKLIG
jgi:hypothetical protein